MSKKDDALAKYAGRYIIGLDIGDKYNGVAVIQADTGELQTIEIASPERLVVNMEQLKPKDIALVGMEEFLLYPWAAQAQAWKTFENIEKIGICKYLLEQKKIPYIMVKAVESKKVYSKERLLRLGYVISHDAHDHQRDALSVALYARDRLATKSKRIRNG